MSLKNNSTKAGIYIHIPFCTVKCMYCDFYSVSQRENEIPHFIDMLCKEIDLFADNHDTNLLVDTIFIGGGTPSLLNKGSIEKIFNTLYKYFNLSELDEITIESNPGEAPKERLKDFINLGINRLSIGFQSFDNTILQFLDRNHTSKDCLTTYDNARSAGFDNINIDLIFDIPNQGIELWKKDLQTAIELNPEHICTYSLTIEKNTTLHKLVKSGKVAIPQEEFNIVMYKYSMDYLMKNQFDQYEISNFARPNYKCLHNLHYWNLEPYYAFGPSANGYDGIKRYWNTSNLDEYFTKISNNTLPNQDEEILTNKQRFNESIFNGFRLLNGISINQLSKYTEKDIYKILEPKIRKWDGLKIEDEQLILDNKYIMLTDEIASDLFLE